MEMMWGKDRRGLESALHIAQQLVVKRSFPRLLANRNHLPHRQLVHSDLTFSTGSCRGGTINNVDIGNGKGSPK